jgi:hypothetical protein
MYVLGCRLSFFKLCGSDFGITPVDDITNGITWVVFCFHTAHISFAGSWYLFCLSVIFWRNYVYLGQLCLSRRCSLFFYLFIIIIITIVIVFSCHRHFLSGNSLEPTVIPTAQASSFTLQYLPYYV